MNAYRKLSAKCYQIDKYVGKSFGDVEYYYERVKNVTGKILEPAVGNGRIMIPLLEKGLTVDGFDYSEDMLQLAVANCQSRGLTPNLSKLDMTDFAIAQVYDAIIIPTGSFLLLDQLMKAKAALNCFYAHLAENGRLIVDLFLPEAAQKGFINKRTFVTGPDELITLEETLVATDAIQQVNTYHNRYEQWQSGALLATELELFPLKWYGVEEFRLLLAATGFTEITISAAYHYGHYPTNPSQTITFEARK
ncbi:MAG: class I SAM-dependent methyltransferase [Lactobacillus sp.]|jgi:ubiquinone/menaquinone biosynthesis C-methylase UbiE|nr:class I SAM-dependent methyltransferase [Lactobacillus sp.]